MNYLFHIRTTPDVKKKKNLKFLPLKIKYYLLYIFFHERLPQLFITYGNNITHQACIIDIHGKR